MQLNCIRDNRSRAVYLLASVYLAIAPCRAAEAPFFITYTHQMEEPGNLEFAMKSVTGRPSSGNRFLGAAAEFEYGVTAWGTSEFYLDGQTTRRGRTLFTGDRLANRCRVLPRQHWINTVLYV